MPLDGPPNMYSYWFSKLGSVTYGRFHWRELSIYDVVIAGFCDLLMSMSLSDKLILDMNCEVVKYYLQVTNLMSLILFLSV